MNDLLCVSSKLNIPFYFINYTSPILSTKLKMTTEWMMVFLSCEPSQKPVLSKQRSQLSRLTPPVFLRESLAHTRELWEGVSRVIKSVSWWYFRGAQIMSFVPESLISETNLTFERRYFLKSGQTAARLFLWFMNRLFEDCCYSLSRGCMKTNIVFVLHVSLKTRLCEISL